MGVGWGCHAGPDLIDAHQIRQIFPLDYLRVNFSLSASFPSIAFGPAGLVHIGSKRGCCIHITLHQPHPDSRFHLLVLSTLEGPPHLHIS